MMSTQTKTAHSIIGNLMMTMIIIIN